jgi:hypothetical protein
MKKGRHLAPLLHVLHGCSMTLQYADVVPSFSNFNANGGTLVA